MTVEAAETMGYSRNKKLSKIIQGNLRHKGDAFDKAI